MLQQESDGEEALKYSSMRGWWSRGDCIGSVGRCKLDANGIM